MILIFDNLPGVVLIFFDVFTYLQNISTFSSIIVRKVPYKEILVNLQQKLSFN